VQRMLKSCWSGGSGGGCNVSIGISSEIKLCSPWYKIDSLDICLLMYSGGHCNCKSMLDTLFSQF